MPLLRSLAVRRLFVVFGVHRAPNKLAQMRTDTSALTLFFINPLCALLIHCAQSTWRATPS